MEIKKTAREKMNGLERLLLKIPGFKGYQEREFRRDSDRVQRDYIVRRLRQVKAGMNGKLQAAARQKDFDLLRDCDLFVKALDKSIGALRYADQGYRGFFDLIKIRESELDRVYEADARIAEMADAFSAEFAAQASDPPDAERLADLSRGLEQLDGLFEQRTALLQGHEKGEGQ
jgi:hypothetical protein